MKHVSIMSKSVPAKALLGHPSLFESIGNFFKDPIGTIRLHF